MYYTFVSNTVKLYNDLAVYQVQKAFEESFDQTAEILLESYLSSLSDIFSDPSEATTPQQIDTETEKDMREMEKEAYLKGNLLFRDWEDWYKSYRDSNNG